jgi:hypothetical protein
MTKDLRSEIVTRRNILSLLGGSAALGVTVPAMLVSASSANAQTNGMLRRQDRRTNRYDRREDRRDMRVERRTGVTTGAAPATTTTGSPPATK